MYTSRSLSPHPRSHRVETAWPLSVGSTHFAPIHMPAYGSTGGPQTPSREGRSQQRPIDETRDTENEVRNNRSQADPDQPLDCGARKAGARRVPLPLSPPEPTRARGRSESGRSAYVTTANNARVSHLQTWPRTRARARTRGGRNIGQKTLRNFSAFETPSPTKEIPHDRRRYPLYFFVFSVPAIFEPGFF